MGVLIIESSMCSRTRGPHQGRVSQKINYIATRDDFCPITTRHNKNKQNWSTVTRTTYIYNAFIVQKLEVGDLLRLRECDLKGRGSYTLAIRSGEGRQIYH